MVEPVTLTATAVALLAPYLAKGAEAAAGKLGEQAAAGVGKLVALVRGRLSGAAAAEALTELAAAPEDADAQGAVRLQLKKAIAADPAFAEELRQLVETVKAAGGDKVQQYVSVTGDNNKAAVVSGSGNKVTF